MNYSEKKQNISEYLHGMYSKLKKDADTINDYKNLLKLFDFEYKEITFYRESAAGELIFEATSERPEAEEKLKEILSFNIQPLSIPEKEVVSEQAEAGEKEYRQKDSSITTTKSAIPAEAAIIGGLVIGGLAGVVITRNLKGIIIAAALGAAVGYVISQISGSNTSEAVPSASGSEDKKKIFDRALVKEVIALREKYIFNLFNTAIDEIEKLLSEEV
jgi:hypothetical protein